MCNESHTEVCKLKRKRIWYKLKITKGNASFVDEMCEVIFATGLGIKIVLTSF